LLVLQVRQDVRAGSWETNPPLLGAAWSLFPVPPGAASRTAPRLTLLSHDCAQVMETTVRACSGKAGAKLFDAMAAKGVTAAVTELSLRPSTTRVVRDRAAEVLTQWAHSVLWDNSPAEDGGGGGESLSQVNFARASSGERLYRKSG
jgi:hypothetical protein